MVVISRSTRAGAHSALLVFGLPVLLMVAGVVFGSMLGSEIWAGALAGLGLGLAILILRLIDRVRDRKGTNLPIIVHIFTREELKGDENEQRNAGIACPNNSDNSDAKG
jgi:positive regulator of sigma E activity